MTYVAHGFNSPQALRSAIEHGLRGFFYEPDGPDALYLDDLFIGQSITVGPTSMEWALLITRVDATTLTIEELP